MCNLAINIQTYLFHASIHMWARNFRRSKWKQIFLMSQHAFYPTITSAVFVINCVLNSNKQTNKKLLHSKKKVFFVVDKIMTIMESIAILVDVTLWYWPLIGIFCRRYYAMHIAYVRRNKRELKCTAKNTLAIQICFFFLHVKFQTTLSMVFKNK